MFWETRRVSRWTEGVIEYRQRRSSRARECIALLDPNPSAPRRCASSKQPMLYVWKMTHTNGGLWCHSHDFCSTSSITPTQNKLLSWSLTCVHTNQEVRQGCLNPHLRPPRSYFPYWHKSYPLPITQEAESAEVWSPDPSLSVIIAEKKTDEFPFVVLFHKSEL